MKKLNLQQDLLNSNGINGTVDFKGTRNFKKKTVRIVTGGNIITHKVKYVNINNTPVFYI